MKKRAGKKDKDKTKSAANVSPKDLKTGSTAQLADNRPEAVAQRKLQGVAYESMQAKQLKANHTNIVQRKISEEESAPVQKKANSTGLPDSLKSGIENLSGHSMDDVKVHYNSPKPAQLQAHAYAQGTDIHVASGQEKHVPHEAWHVVQQKQGRVNATKQLKGIAVNDNSGLEREADIMGAKAMQMKSNPAGKTDSVKTALSSSALQRKGKVLQGVFTGFAGGGWNLDNSGLPGNMNIFPGGGNNVGGGQQAGATGRVINVASGSAYAAPKALGGFTHFSNTLTAKILYQPGGKPKRYTHLHVINGKTHGPGTANNLTLGSTADNNHHRAQAEDFIRNGLAANNTATTYWNNLAATPPFTVQGGVAYWNKPGGLVMVGAQKAAPGATVAVGINNMPYTHSADPANLHKETRWAHYSVVPNYGGVLSPTIRSNIAKRYKTVHSDEIYDFDTNHVALMAPNTRAAARLFLQGVENTLDAAVTGAALAGGVAGVTGAASLIAIAAMQGRFGAGNANVITYAANMGTLDTDVANFAAWSAAAFPTSLVCDADLYKASYDPLTPWFKRSEAQTAIVMNNL